MQTKLERRAPGAGLGIDLTEPSGKAKLLQARKRAQRAHLADEVALEQDRLTRRVVWLTKKVARLALNSNGRKKAQAEGMRLVLLGGLLQQALDGGDVQKINGTGRTRFEARAISLLNDLVA